MRNFLTGLWFLFSIAALGQHQVKKAPQVKEGDGPYRQLIIRGVILVDGTGAPPTGPVDIEVRQNKITAIHTVGYPGLPIDPGKRPKLGPGGKELSCEGMYLLPGFIDMHAHIGGGQAPYAEYVFKLWMGHGITSIRDPACENGLDWVLDEKEKSARGLITAPRIFAYNEFGKGTDITIDSPEKARAWVHQNQEKGADGIKFFGAAPDIIDAALRENKKLGLRSAYHHDQLDVARWNVVNSARAGLTTMEHWYGLPEALFENHTLQDYPPNYNYRNEQDRFEEAGKLWRQAAPPYSPHWNDVMDELLSCDLTLDPTFTVYEACRDVHRARTSEWHREYTLPSLWNYFQPSKISHMSFWQTWGTEQEVSWRENYRLWMTFVNEYKNRGGRVTTGSDSGIGFQVYGFSYIRELELLVEAGFLPLEVIRSATLYGAQALGKDKEIGSVEVGKLADFVILKENPLQNLQVLYGTGAVRLTDEGKVVRTGGIKYTVKDGIIYDAEKLLADVRKMVAEEKIKSGFEFKQPGVE